jgi:hypothetical protein
VLTPPPSEWIIFPVISRKVVCLLVLILISLASLCLVPFGQGPYSVVCGPKTAFRAYRAALQLTRAVAATIFISLIANVLALSRRAYSDLDADSRLASANPSSMISTLRC